MTLKTVDPSLAVLVLVSFLWTYLSLTCLDNETQKQVWSKISLKIQTEAFTNPFACK